MSCQYCGGGSGVGSGFCTPLCLCSAATFTRTGEYKEYSKEGLIRRTLTARAVAVRWLRDPKEGRQRRHNWRQAVRGKIFQWLEDCQVFADRGWKSPSRPRTTLLSKDEEVEIRREFAESWFGDKRRWTDLKAPLR